MSFQKSEALRRAEEHISKGEITGAIAIHRMIVQADPYDLNTINALGELYVRAGRTKDAIEDFTRIADGYLSSGSGIKAAYLLKKALDMNASNAPALMKLGEIYLREGMTEKAHEHFIKAGELLAREGSFTGALQANHRALTARPTSQQAKAAIAALQADAAASETGPLARLQSPNGEGLASSRGPDEVDGKLASAALDPVSAADDEEFVIQELSKAEMLVGYGEVDRAIALLKDVLSHSPDNLDVHVKLKDIYLRNEMMKEAEEECLELARIHEARGESARGNEYTLRASRLARTTGHLVIEPAAQVSESVAKQSMQKVAAPSESTETCYEPRATEVGSEPGPIEQAPPRVTPTNPPAVVSKPIPRETDPSPAGIPAAASRQPEISKAAPQTPKPVAERAPVNLGLRVSENHVVTVPPSKAEIANRRKGSNSLSLPSTLGLARAASSPMSTKKPRWLYAAPVALLSVTALSLGAMKGASIYDGELTRQYEKLALSSVPSLPLPPGLPSPEDLQPSAQNEAATIESPSPLIVTPAKSEAEQESTLSQPPAVNSEPRATVANEPPKTTKPVAASPPMMTLTDQRGGESYVPRGLPTGAPQTAAPLPNPPPSLASPRKASTIARGEAIKRVEPVYPAIARSTRQQGTVAVDVSINEKGDVVSARAMSGPAPLRDAAESAARQWKFRPSTRDGKPITTVITINFSFKL